MTLIETTPDFPRPAVPENTSIQHFIQKARDCIASARTIEAHAAAAMALNAAPNSIEAQALLANTWLLLGAPHLAAEYAQNALNAVPSNADALLALAGAARRIGDRDMADKASAALSSVPSAAAFHELLSVSDLLEAGEYEYALFRLAEAQEREPENVHIKALFFIGFEKLKATGSRFNEFIDAVGLKFPEDNGLSATPWTTPEACSIDIVIPVHNALEDLLACLASIRKWWSGSIGKIILVDDASNPETAKWLDNYVQNHKEAILVRSRSNGGFTATVCAGLARSKAPYAVLLNSDTVVSPGWIDRLWSALNRRWTTALAGPLSNNAYFQTVIPQEDQPRAEGALSDSEDTDLEMAAARTLLTSRKICPRVPLLSGFCLMMRRDIYELAGGLDVAAFPQGYWEVQDLCLRLLDLGYDAVIADDVYVHHRGSRSIDGSRRTRLLHEGQRLMHQKHSAMRLLVAEAICAHEPEIAYHRGHWQTFIHNRRMTGDEKANPELPIAGCTRRALKVIKFPQFDAADEEVCLFVAHAPLAQVSDYTLQYLHALRATGIRVIVVAAIHHLEIPVQGALSDASDGTVLRIDGGYDFAAWADLLERFPQLWQAKRLYFANDSLVGPFTPLDTIIDGIRRNDAGFFALSESTNTGYHAQSFFFGWSRRNLTAEALRAFWSEIAVQPSKLRVVLEYEYRIAALSRLLPDPTQDIVFGMDRAFGSLPVDISCVNPTHHAWRRLLKIGFPFVKTDLIRDGVGGIETEGWELLCQHFGADTDAMNRHIERSRIQRMCFGANRPWESWTKGWKYHDQE